MFRFAVADMSCGHCAQAVTQALTVLDPGAQVAVDLASKTVEVATSADGHAVAAAIRDAGYTPIEA